MTWQTVAKTSQTEQNWPPRRSAAGFGAFMNRYLVMIGGHVTDQYLAKDCWLLDSFKLSWHKIGFSGETDLPLSRAYDGPLIPYPSEENPTHLILVGAEQNTHEIWALDLNTLKFHPISLSKDKEARYESARVIVDKIVYQFAGRVVAKQMMCNEAVFSLDIRSIMDRLPKTTNQWICFHCGGYSTKKCSLCKKVPFCSEECEKDSALHKEICGKDVPSKETVHESKDSHTNMQLLISQKLEEYQFTHQQIMAQLAEE
jgi:hypothetical protein